MSITYTCTIATVAVGGVAIAAMSSGPFVEYCVRKKPVDFRGIADDREFAEESKVDEWKEQENRCATLKEQVELYASGPSINCVAIGSQQAGKSEFLNALFRAMKSSGIPFKLKPFSSGTSVNQAHLTIHSLSLPLVGNVRLTDTFGMTGSAIESAAFKSIIEHGIPDNLNKDDFEEEVRQERKEMEQEDPFEKEVNRKSTSLVFYVVAAESLDSREVNDDLRRLKTVLAKIGRIATPVGVVITKLDEVHSHDNLSHFGKLKYNSYGGQPRIIGDMDYLKSDWIVKQKIDRKLEFPSFAVISYPHDCDYRDPWCDELALTALLSMLEKATQSRELIASALPVEDFEDVLAHERQRSPSSREDLY